MTYTIYYICDKYYINITLMEQQVSLIFNSRTNYLGKEMKLTQKGKS